MVVVIYLQCEFALPFAAWTACSRRLLGGADFGPFGHENRTNHQAAPDGLVNDTCWSSWIFL